MRLPPLPHHPACGSAGIARVPVWIFHGANDETVPVELSRKAFRQLSEAGGAPRYTEFAEGEHRISVYAWTQPGLGDWVFAQQLPGGMPK